MILLNIKETKTIRDRHDRELEFGRKLAAGDTLSTWGWSTPAGKKRAARRGELIANCAFLRRGMNVLEIGCGTGMFTEMFSSSGSNITALDISPELIVQAKNRKLPEDVSFICSGFEDSTLPLASFDAVIGSSVLHHLDITIAFSRIFELLKPGGVMAFAEPNMLNPQIFLERRFRRFFSHISQYETAFVRWSTEKALNDAGFSGVRIKPFDWLHPSIPLNLIGIVEKTGLILESCPIIREFSGSILIVAKKM